MKNYKKILSGLLAALMVLALIPAAAFSTFAAETKFSGGSGTKADPYQIATAEDFIQLSKDVNGGNPYADTYFVQTNDLNLSGKTLTPIGYSKYASNTGITSDTRYFAGHYNGCGYTAIEGYIANWGADGNTNTHDAPYNGQININTLMVSDAQTSWGLFGNVIGGSVSNLNVKDIRVGYRNDASNAFLSSKNLGFGFANELGKAATCAGAVVGYAENAVIANCKTSYTIGSKYIFAFYYAGGIVGYAKDTTILGCVNDMRVSSIYATGGIVGGGNNLTIKYCMNDETLSVFHNDAAMNCGDPVGVAGTDAAQAVVGGIMGRHNTVGGANEKMIFEGCINGELVNFYVDSKSQIGATVKDAEDNAIAYRKSADGSAVRIYSGGMLGYTGGVAEAYELIFKNCFNLAWNSVYLNHALGYIVNGSGAERILMPGKMVDTDKDNKVDTFQAADPENYAAADNKTTCYKVGAILGQISTNATVEAITAAAWKAKITIDGCHTMMHGVKGNIYATGSWNNGNTDNQWKTVKELTGSHSYSLADVGGFTHSGLGASYYTATNSTHTTWTDSKEEAPQKAKELQATAAYQEIMEYITPTPVESDDAVKFYGWQETAPVENKASVRFIAVLDSLDYKEVGFKFTNAEGKTATLSTSTVYQSISANTAGGLRSYLAKELGGKYIIAVTFTNVPTNVATTLDVRAYSKVGGVVTEYTTATITLFPQA